MDDENAPYPLRIAESYQDIEDAEVDILEVPTDHIVEGDGELTLVGGASLAMAPPVTAGPGAGESRPAYSHTRSITAARQRGEGTKTRAAVKPIPSLQLPVMGTLKRANRILSSNPVPFLTIAILASMPNILIQLEVIESTPSLSFLFMQNFGTEILAYIFHGVAVFAVVQYHHLGRIHLGDVISKGFSRFLPVAITAILVMLISLCSLVPAVVAIVAGVNFFLALLLIPIPLLFSYCTFLTAVSACVVERLGPIASIRRSVALTRNFRGPIFWILFCWGMFYVGVSMCIGIFLQIWVMRTAMELLRVAFTNVLVGVIYHDLRVVKEGMSSERLARVFN